MYDASIHHLDKISELIAGVGALLGFLPPYSPELNPTEHVFSKVKAFLKANDREGTGGRDQQSYYYIKEEEARQYFRGLMTS